MSQESILVVDDEPDIRNLVQEILMDEGYQVSVAEDTTVARQQASSKRPDLVLLCLLYTSPSPRDATLSRMPSSA